MENQKAVVVILYGEPGTRKTTIVNAIGYDESVSATTRAKREGEVHGKHYFFVDRETFNPNDFYEFKQFPDTNNMLQTYGTPKLMLRDYILRKEPISVVLEAEGVVEVEKKLREEFGENVIIVKAHTTISNKQTIINSLLAEGYTEDAAWARLNRGDDGQKVRYHKLDIKADCTFDEYTVSHIDEIEEIIGIRSNYKDREALVRAVAQYETLDEFKNDCLFHGSGERIKGKLKGSGYDGMLWTAKTPTVAQNYIGSPGTVIAFRKPCSFEEKIPFSILGYRDMAMVDLVRQMGYELDVTRGKTGVVISYTAKKNGENASLPTHKEIYTYLTDVLGYPKENSLRVKMRYDGEKLNFLPSDYKKNGKLFVFLGASNLKVADIAKAESDLTEVEYHQTGNFKTLEERGYDAVRINDFAQSENWGNVGHVSLGLTSHGLEKMQGSCFCIGAKNFDWGENSMSLRQTSTPEFSFEEIFEESRAYRNQKDMDRIIGIQSDATVGLQLGKRRSI